MTNNFTPLPGQLWVRNSYKRRGWRVRITETTPERIYFLWAGAKYAPDYYGREFFLRAFDPVPEETPR